ncbi:MAG: DUF1552 domain-containing protein [Akkermansiaceae bacterium]|nr:DUF1552 domain-containing protein [Akkermansiaceae bacterium]
MIGVGVPHRADPWTRNTYAGSNQPLAPISDPYLLFETLYGQVKDRGNVVSVLDEVREDLRHIAACVDPEEKALLDQHATFVREMERDLQSAGTTNLIFPPPNLEAGVALDNDGIPKISTMQTDLLVSAFANGLARVATLQYTNSVGQAQMRWLGTAIISPMNRTAIWKLKRSWSKSTFGSANNWCNSSKSSMRFLNLAAQERCSTTQPLSGPTNSVRAIVTV